MNTALELKNISKIYQEGGTELVAVDSVSLVITRGEVVAVMGPSGSGKTTLLSIMGCILRPTKGEILISGRPVSGLDENSLPHVRRRHFGFVFQSFNLFPALTAVENVEIALRMKRWPAFRRRAHARELLEKVSLGEKTHSYPRDLSGGQKQRVAIARALAGEPEFILADEPTANLDSRMREEIIQICRELVRNENKAVVIVTHDPKVGEAADRIVEMNDGRLVQCAG
jgi:putative ABC transport system ATP-binding protein